MGSCTSFILPKTVNADIDKCCAIKSDPINDYIEKMVMADSIIIASPVYYGNVTTEVKALIDRACFVSNCNGMLLRHKVGAAIVSARWAGSTPSWNIGDYEHDIEGIKTMEILGDNMAWLLKKLEG